MYRISWLALLLVVFVVSACRDTMAPRAESAYVLTRIGSQPLPVVLDRSAFRTIEILAGSLVLDPGQRRGQFIASSLVRITDTDKQPVQNHSSGDGTFSREGNRLSLRFADGGTATYSVEEEGRVLRYTGGNCAQTCLGILREYVFERAAVVH